MHLAASLSIVSLNTFPLISRSCRECLEARAIPGTNFSSCVGKALRQCVDIPAAPQQAGMILPDHAGHHIDLRWGDAPLARVLFSAGTVGGCILLGLPSRLRLQL